MDFTSSQPIKADKDKMLLEVDPDITGWIQSTGSRPDRRGQIWGINLTF